MAHRLAAAIAELSLKADLKRTYGDDEEMLFSGPHGKARVIGRRVYYFDPGAEVADEIGNYKSKVEAKFYALTWVVEGKI